MRGAAIGVGEPLRVSVSGELQAYTAAQCPHSLMKRYGLENCEFRCSAHRGRRKRVEVEVKLVKGAR